MNEEKNNEEIKEEAVTSEGQAEKAEPITEEPQIIFVEKKSKGKTALIIIMFIIILALIGTIIFLLLNGNKKETAKDNKHENNTEEKEENNKNEKNEEQNNKEEKPVDTNDDSDPNKINISIKNINSNKNYSIQLLKKENTDPNNSNEYVYAFYDKTNQKMITDYKYGDITCGTICKIDPNETGCIETTVEAFSFKVNNIDYIYATYNVSLCGGIDSNYLIYNATSKKLLEEGEGARANVDNINGNIVIYTSNAGDDVCGAQGIDVLSCYGMSGYIFARENEFTKITGVDAFKVGGKYAIVSYSEKRSDNTFSINFYNEKGLIINSLKNCVSYNEKYVLINENKKLVLYDLNTLSKIADLENIEFEDNYYYGPRLEDKKGKTVLYYGLKTEEYEKQSSEFYLPI